MTLYFFYFEFDVSFFNNKGKRIFIILQSTHKRKGKFFYNILVKYFIKYFCSIKIFHSGAIIPIPPETFGQ